MSTTPQTPALPVPGTRSPAPSRTLGFTLLAVAAVLALVYLLPTREEGAARPVRDRLATVIVELDEPPEWARERGHDEVERCLDRLAWGSHAAGAAAREVLAQHAGQLAPEILGRLASLGDSDPVLSTKLVELLGAEDPAAPGVLDELVARALSFPGMEARAALRTLARVDHPRAVNAIKTRLFDQDAEVVGFARGALAELARRGNAEAREAVLAELEADPLDVDLAYLTVAGAFPRDERTDALLHEIAVKGQGTVRLVALTGLLVRDDPQARAAFEEWLAVGDLDQRLQALRAAGSANAVIGQEQWDTLLDQNIHVQSAALVRVLFGAVDTGHADAARALYLLEGVATQPGNSAQTMVLDALFARRHPNVIEGVRSDILVVAGTALTLTVDRILTGPTDRPSDLQLRAELGQLALARLESSEALRDGDRVTLCRLVATIVPEDAADLLVDYALGRRGASRLVADEVAELLGTLGVPALVRLESELGTPEGDALFVYAAAESGAAAALPGLERILLAPGTEPETRRAALDSFALMHTGPREESLRRVIAGLSDPQLRRRAQLVFWNYL